MTDATAPTAVRPRGLPSIDVRSVLRIDAATSAVNGALLAAGAGPLDDILGTGRPGIVRAVGALLLVYALGLVLLARAPWESVRRLVPITVAADAGWVVGTAIGIGLGWFDIAGAVLAVAAAVIVAGLALTKRAGI